MSKAVLVVGATGGTGLELVTQALAAGHEVTALVRAAWRLPVSSPRLRVVVGNVMDPSPVDAAVRGQDAVLCALGHRRYYSTARVLSRGTQHIVDAMARHGVRRLICETALGVGDSWWQLGLYYTLFVRVFVLPVYFRDKVRQEAVVRTSGLEWTIVRPGVLTDGAKRGAYRTGPKVGSAIRTVSVARADVAGFMLGALDEEARVRATVGIAN